MQAEKDKKPAPGSGFVPDKLKRCVSGSGFVPDKLKRCVSGNGFVPDKLKRCVSGNGFVPDKLKRCVSGSGFVPDKLKRYASGNGFVVFKLKRYASECLGAFLSVQNLNPKFTVAKWYHAIAKNTIFDRFMERENEKWVFGRFPEEIQMSVGIFNIIVAT